jgi:Uma2 family endonuclease
MSTEAIETMIRERPDVAWEVAPLLPEQGDWSEQDYLWLTSRTNRLVEFSDGYVEVLPMPTDKHQSILGYLFLLLHACAERIGGKVLVAALRVRLRTGKYREPDIVFLLSANDPRRHNEYWEGADLVVEIVSPDDPDRDIVIKRQEYAEIGIPEYWIVNPEDETITVLRLAHDVYIEYRAFRRGEMATSALLEGFAVSVDAVLDAK